MGLLSKAANSGVNVEFTLDEMGMALKERISRLSTNRHTPYTALNLLKTYCPFMAGICLSLKDGVYTSYTSVGMGVEKVSFPEENLSHLTTLEQSEGQIKQQVPEGFTRPGEEAIIPFFKFSADTGKSLGIKNYGEDSVFWVFNLGKPGVTSPEAWHGIMILCVQGKNGENASFDPKSAAAIIEGNNDKFLYGPEDDLSDRLLSGKIQQNDPEPHEDPAEEYFAPMMQEDNFADNIHDDNIPDDSIHAEPSVEEQIMEYHRANDIFNFIILESPSSATEKEKADFCSDVSFSLSMSGTAISLREGCLLILLPGKADRELITHRLSRSFNATAVASFETNSPENAGEKIRSLL